MLWGKGVSDEWVWVGEEKGEGDIGGRTGFRGCLDFGRAI